MMSETTFRNVCLISLLVASIFYLRYEHQHKNDAPEEANGIRKTYRDDGSLYTEANYIDGKMHGVCKTYHPDGKVFREENYVNNMLHGKALQYYASGILYSETMYDSGRIDGIVKRYHKDGKLKAEAPFKKGQECLGLKEYILNGDPRPHYPDIVIEADNSAASEGTYRIKFSLTERVQRAEFFVGELNDGCLQDSLLAISPTGKDTGEIVYKIAQGQVVQERLNVVAKIQTIAGNILIKQKSHSVSIRPSLF